jgi:hypothetical protein
MEVPGMMSLTEMLTKAFTATEPPVQTHGLEFIPDEHEILGDVPTHVQWVHTMSSELADEVNKLIEELKAATDDERKKQLMTDIHAGKQNYEVLDSMRWKLLEEAFTPDPERHCGLAILNGWKAAATLRKDDPGEDLIKALFAGMLRMRAGGSGNPDADGILDAMGGGVLIMGLGGMRR